MKTVVRHAKSKLLCAVSSFFVEAEFAWQSDLSTLSISAPAPIVGMNPLPFSIFYFATRT